MDILNSDWLISMLKKSSSTPHGRLLCLFEILEDWLDLLNATQLNTTQLNIAEQVRSGAVMQASAHQLQDYLTIEAAKAGAAMPEMLASQLYFMAIAAAQEKLKAHNLASLSHAKSAANALILAQTKKEFHLKKSSLYAIAASFLGVLVVAGALYNNQYLQNSALPNKSLAARNMPIKAANVQTVSADNLADPEQTAALMAQIELMRHGNCQLIEAIQLPDQSKGIYLNMVVNGQVSTDPREQKIAFALLKQTRCNYTPMLMANSK